MSSSGDGGAPRPHRFTAAMRMHGRRIFAAAYAAKVRGRSGPLLVFGRPNASPLTRLGLSVSRRVGGSVERHRVKRLLREAFRTIRPDLPAGYDLLVVVHPHEFLPVESYRDHLRHAAGQIDRRWRQRPPDAPDAAS